MYSPTYILFIFGYLFINQTLAVKKTYSSLFRESNSITYKIISKKYVYFPRWIFLIY